MTSAEDCILGFRQIDNYQEITSNLIQIRKPNKNKKQSNKFRNAKKKRKMLNKTKVLPSTKEGKKQQKKKLVFSSVLSYNGTVDPVELNDEDLPAWRAFELPDPIMMSLKAYNLTNPTEVQEKVVHSAITSNKDIAIAAETGSGKTLCYGIPIVTAMLTRYVDNSFLGRLHALILVPTRELALQVKDHLLKLCAFTPIKILAIVGGISEVKQIRLLKRSPEIIVATPGRLWNLYKMGLPHLTSEDTGLANVKFLVVDEADRLFEHAHFSELKQILDAINTESHVQKQCFILSATLNTSQDGGFSMQNISQLAESLSISPTKMLVFDLTNPEKTVRNLTEKRILCDFNEKDIYLYYLITTRRSHRTLVFANSITAIKRLASLLVHLNLKPFILHAKMHQKQRLKNLEVYSGTSNAVLLATDVAARGLDIPKIDLVIHYQLPRSVELYIHRSGRTARGSNVSGDTILLVCPEEAKLYDNLLSKLDRDKNMQTCPVDLSQLQRVRQFVTVSRKIEKLQHLLHRETSNFNWFQRMAMECDLEVDDYLEDRQEFRKDVSHRYKQELNRLQELRKQILIKLNKAMDRDRLTKSLQQMKC